MAATLKQLETRLAVVERELKALRKKLKAPTASGNGSSKKKREKSLLELADEEHDDLVAASIQTYKEMEITGKPVGAEKLQQMMIDAGIDPRQNLFSREIMAMREE